MVALLIHSAESPFFRATALILTLFMLWVLPRQGEMLQTKEAPNGIVCLELDRQECSRDHHLLGRQAGAPYCDQAGVAGLHFYRRICVPSLLYRGYGGESCARA